ncbi:hypothetical protein EB796_008641 [Bugula neritina]|uniref:Uncharacterized protein n=1 Tax=Bugula neritina TaxID=10212 RepID=A0A7J7K356_BUGNE|nr:hypothetical protein EB796_008641 [Bugula neritina]
MSSQSDSVDKLKSQSVTNIFSNIIQVSSSLHLDKFSKSLELCSKASLQDVDSIFLDYFETFIQQLKEHLGNNSESSLETLSVLVQSLLDYLAILINSGSCDPSAVADAFLLSDIKGCLLLSCHLIDVSVSHVLSLIISQSLQHLANQIKSVWNLVIEFILKYIEVIEKYTTTGHSAILPLLSQVVLCLVKVAADIADVDTKVMVLLYKCIVSRILAKEVEYYRTENVINKVIKGVCQSTLTKLGSETAFQVTTESKVIGFLLRILGRLITFIVDVPDKCVDWSQVIEIIGGVSDSLCEVMYDHSESNSNLDLPLKSLITSCLPSAQFSCEIIKRAVTSGHRLSSLLYAICTVQECLAKCATVYAHWWAEPYLSQLLTFYTMCGNELCRPTTFNNRVQTCYEFVLARLSAMLVTMPSGDDFIRVHDSCRWQALCQCCHLSLE